MAAVQPFIFWNKRQHIVSKNKYIILKYDTQKTSIYFILTLSNGLLTQL